MTPGPPGAIVTYRITHEKPGRTKKWDSKTVSDIYPDTGPRTSEDEFESLEMFLAVTSLGRKKAGVLEAFYYDGMSVREIADEMAISVRAVEGLLRRARQSLKSLLPNSTSDGGIND